MILVVALAGCAIVDQYSGRAVSYNLEAEQALDQGLLLNIVRASMQRPMQFTSVQTISGTATATASATFTVPFAPVGGSSMFNPQISGGPTFTVPVLDTQEFYQGVMSPVPSVLFDFFIQEEFPREELFTLFVEKIVMHRNACADTDHTPKCELLFVNSPGSEVEFYLTQSLFEYLLNLGLTTEQIPNSADDSAGSGGSKKSKKSKDDSDSDDDNSQQSTPNFRFCFASRNREYTKLITDESERCGYYAQEERKEQEKEKAKKKKNSKEKTVTTTKEMTIDPQTGGIRQEVDRTVFSVSAEKAPKTKKKIGRKTPVSGFVVADAFIDKLIKIAEALQSESDQKGEARRDYWEFKQNIDAFRASHAAPAKGKAGTQKSYNTVTLSIYTRSTEGILYFLGEVVRHQIHPGQSVQPDQESRIVEIKTEKTSYRIFPELPCGFDDRKGRADMRDSYKCQNLFVVDMDFAGFGAASPASVTYDGVRYWVPADERETMHVLSIVKQLMAVNTSAKSLPQTNVLGVIAP